MIYSTLLLLLSVLLLSTVTICTTFINYTSVNNKKEERHFSKPQIETMENQRKIIVKNQFLPILNKTIFGSKLQVQQILFVKCNVSEILSETNEVLPPLDYFEISGNNLTTIKTGFFNSLKTKALYLGNNSINFVESGAFNNNTHLEEINLEHNNIKEVNPEWFANSKNIRSIVLNYNRITQIPPRAFSNLKKDALVSIWLMNNQITEIHPEAFGGVKKMFLLNLSENLIEDFPENLLQNGTIIMLNLNNNKLKDVSDEIFKKVAMLYVKNNQFSEEVRKRLVEKGAIV